MCVRLFFFFKQKTAYEMRISDWSSDVCSSDLPLARLPRDDPWTRHRLAARFDRAGPSSHASLWSRPLAAPAGRPRVARTRRKHSRRDGVARDRAVPAPHHGRASPPVAARQARAPAHDRSEEHTSELQSLMRNSYAVFCLKKKKQKI